MNSHHRRSYSQHHRKLYICEGEEQLKLSTMYKLVIEIGKIEVQGNFTSFEDGVEIKGVTIKNLVVPELILKPNEPVAVDLPENTVTTN